MSFRDYTPYEAEKYPVAVERIDKLERLLWPIIKLTGDLSKAPAADRNLFWYRMIETAKIHVEFPAGLAILFYGMSRERAGSLNSCPCAALQSPCRWIRRVMTAQSRTCKNEEAAARETK